MRWVGLGRRADLMLGSLGHSSDLAPGWMLRFGVWPGSRSGSVPPFHPSTLPHLGAQCRWLTGTDPLFCAAALAVFRSPSTLRSPLTRTRIFPFPTPQRRLSTTSPTWSIFSRESHGLRWLGRPLLYPFEAALNFFSVAALPARLILLPCPASAHSPANRFIGTLLPPAFDCLDAGSAAPEPRLARLHRFPLASSSRSSRSALSGPVCSLSPQIALVFNPRQDPPTTKSYRFDSTRESHT